MNRRLCAAIVGVLLLASPSFARQSAECTLNKKLDARPASVFVTAMKKYKSAIQLSIGDRTVNAKSIMSLVALGLREGHTVTITAEGSDEAQAVQAAKNCLENL